MRHRALAVLVLLALATVMACRSGSPTNHSKHRTAVNPDVLTVEESRLAVEIASSDSRVREFLATEQPVYVARVELLRLKEAERERFALVSHFRYEGDLTIQSVVDLGRREVTQVNAIPHLPTPLAAEEVARAQELAMASEKLHFVMEDDLSEFTERRPGFEIEALALRSNSEEDPIFGHRVVSLLFKTPRGYVAGIEVLVDLTTGEVTVERTGRGEEAP